MLIRWIRFKNRLLRYILKKFKPIQIKKWAYRKRLMNEYIIAMLEYRKHCNDKMPVEEANKYSGNVLRTRSALQPNEVEKSIKKYERMKRWL